MEAMLTKVTDNTYLLTQNQKDQPHTHPPRKINTKLILICIKIETSDGTS